MLAELANVTEATFVQRLSLPFTIVKSPTEHTHRAVTGVKVLGVIGQQLEMPVVHLPAKNAKHFTRVYSRAFVDPSLKTTLTDRAGGPVEVSGPSSFKSGCPSFPLLGSKCTHSLSG